MKKRIIFLVLICIVTFGLVGCTDNTSKEIKKDNKPSKEKADWEKFPQSNTNYDFSDANNKEITKIFNHLGFYYSNTNDGEEHLWGLTFQNLYNEMKKYEESNKFAKLYINEANKVKIDEYNNLEIDFLNAYMKMLFAHLNSLEELPITDEELPSVEDIGKVTKIYLNNYDSTYKTKETGSYRILYCHFKKVNRWAIIYSSDLEGDNNHIDFYKKLDFSVATPDSGDETIVNNIIKNNYEFFNFLIQYRNKVYSKEIEKELGGNTNSNSNQKYEPSIGMTADEVKKSTWGYPDKVNKDTYSWGVQEQWVYNKKGYIYFKNGVVSSISER